MDTSVYFDLSSLNLCFRAFCYFMNPASNKNFIHLLFFRFDFLKSMRLTYPKMYSILAENVKNCVGLRRSSRPSSREGLLAFGNRSFAPSALALSPFFSRSVPPKVRYRFSPLSVVDVIRGLVFRYEFKLDFYSDYKFYRGSCLICLIHS